MKFIQKFVLKTAPETSMGRRRISDASATRTRTEGVWLCNDIKGEETKEEKRLLFRD